MNWLPLRLKLLIFRNKYTVIVAIILMVGLVTLVKYAVFFAYNQHARATFMKPFYDKVALAEKYDTELPLSNFVSRTTTHTVNTSSNGQSGWLENCSVPGTYFDYPANKQLSNVRFCSYGYISYFWVAVLDDSTISRAAQQMKTAGWTLLDDAAGQAVNRQRVDSTMLGGYSFSRPGGLMADMLFINKPQQLQNSGSFSAYPYWEFVTHTRDPHSFFLAVNVSYSVRMQGNQLLDE